MPPAIDDEPHCCLAPFKSQLLSRRLPPAEIALANMEGQTLPDATTAGFSPGAFALAAPGDPQSGFFITDDAAWPRGRAIRVHFLDGTADKKNAVETLVKAWSDVSEVEFEFGVLKSQSDIRVTFNLQGFFSLVGRDALRSPNETMSLGFNGRETPEDRRRLILHEFGHAIGMMHEHQHPAAGIRWNRAGALQYYKPRLPGLSDQQIMDQLEATPLTSRPYLKTTEFDPTSIMMYFIPPIAVDPGFYDPDKFGRNNTELSKGDGAVARMIYGGTTDDEKENGGGKERVLKLDGPPLADSIETDEEVDLYVVTIAELGKYMISVAGNAFVHVEVTDDDGNPPPGFEGDRGENTISQFHGLHMVRPLLPGKQHVRVTGHPGMRGMSRGQYTIQIETRA